MRCISCMEARRFCSACCSASGDGADGLLGLRLMGLRGFARACGLGSGVLEEAAVLFEFAGEAGKLFARLREIVGAGGEAAR